MINNHRRISGMVGLALGVLLAPPLIALLASPLASADPTDAAVGTAGQIITFGPYPFDGYTDTLSINDATFALDNYLTGSGFDLDLYSAPGSDSYEVLLTDPGVVQLGVDDVGGTFSFIDNFPPPTSSIPTLVS
jgi:hypothetical protein